MLGFVGDGVFIITFVSYFFLGPGKLSYTTTSIYEFLETVNTEIISLQRTSVGFTVFHDIDLTKIHKHTKSCNEISTY